MALKFIDLDVGLPHLWSKIKALIAKNGTPTVTATSSDGVTYTATLSGVTALTTGLTITIVPSVVSTSISAKLNLNNLGAKYIRQSTTNNTATGLTPKNAGWMAANKPITIQYDGTQWKTIAARSNASDMNGTLAIANGGTGATSAADARTNLGLGALATLGTVPIANGGTGATTIGGIHNVLGIAKIHKGTLDGKTINDLRQYMLEVVRDGTHLSAINISAHLKWIDLWNGNDTTTVVGAGQTWEIRFINRTSLDYFTVEIANYYTNEMSGEMLARYRVSYCGGVWSKVESFDGCVKRYNNGTEWYRLYADGWCEQGGDFKTTTTSVNTVNLLYPMKDTDYQVYGETDGGYVFTPRQRSGNTTTSFTYYVTDPGQNYVDGSGWWKVCGYYK